MRQILIFCLFLFSMIIEACSQNHRKNTVFEVVRIKTIENDYLKETNSINLLSIYNDSLFVISNNKFIIINPDYQTISENIYISDFINELLKKERYINQLLVNQFGYWLSTSKNIYLLSSNGNIKYHYSHNSEIYYFSITQTKDILISTKGSVALVTLEDGLIKQNFETALSTHNFFDYENGIGFLGMRKIIFFNKKGLDIDKREININLYEGKDENFYPSYATQSRLIGFSYFKRDKIYIFPIDMFDLDSKIINLPEDFAPSINEIQEEEGVPNFKILGSDDFCNVIILRSNYLIILKVIW